MATKTFFLVDAADANGWQALSESTQTAATIVGGWIVGTGSTNHSEFEQGNERASSTFTGTTVPDGTLDSSLNDAFRSPAALTGNFASANWVLHFVVRAVTSATGQDGRVRFRLIKADADGSNATEITSGQQQASIVTDVTAAADFDSTLTFNPGAFSITNQFLFIQVAWERTGAASMSTADIDFRTGSSSSVGTRFTTSDFTSNTTVTPSAVTAAMSVATPTVVKGTVTKTPSAVTVSMSVATPTLIKVRTLTPTAVTAAFSVATPTVVRGARVMTPGSVSAVFSVPTPTVSSSGGGPPPPARKYRVVTSNVRWAT